MITLGARPSSAYFLALLDDRKKFQWIEKDGTKISVSPPGYSFTPHIKLVKPNGAWYEGYGAYKNSEGVYRRIGINTTEVEVESLINYYKRSARTDKMRAYKARLSRQRAAKAQKEREERLAKAKYLAIDFSANWADEFNIRGSTVETREEWDKYMGEVQEGWFPQRVSFGSNQSVEYESREDYFKCFDLRPIPKYAYEGFRRARYTTDVGTILWAEEPDA